MRTGELVHAARRNRELVNQGSSTSVLFLHVLQIDIVFKEQDLSKLVEDIKKRIL